VRGNPGDFLRVRGHTIAGGSRFQRSIRSRDDKAKSLQTQSMTFNSNVTDTIT
jgi:hypothetical protein